MSEQDSEKKHRSWLPEPRQLAANTIAHVVAYAAVGLLGLGVIAVIAVSRWLWSNGPSLHDLVLYAIFALALIVLFSTRQALVGAIRRIEGGVSSEVNSRSDLVERSGPDRDDWVPRIRKLLRVYVDSGREVEKHFTSSSFDIWVTGTGRLVLDAFGAEKQHEFRRAGESPGIRFDPTFPKPPSPSAEEGLAALDEIMKNAPPMPAPSAGLVPAESLTNPIEELNVQHEKNELREKLDWLDTLDSKAASENLQDAFRFDDYVPRRQPPESG